MRRPAGCRRRTNRATAGPHRGLRRARCPAVAQGRGRHSGGPGNCLAGRRSWSLPAGAAAASRRALEARCSLLTGRAPAPGKSRRTGRGSRTRTAPRRVCARACALHARVPTDRCASTRTDSDGCLTRMDVSADSDGCRMDTSAPIAVLCAFGGRLARPSGRGRRPALLRANPSRRSGTPARRNLAHLGAP